jgi:hypothetical protein
MEPERERYEREFYLPVKSKIVNSKKAFGFTREIFASFSVFLGLFFSFPSPQSANSRAVRPARRAMGTAGKQAWNFSEFGEQSLVHARSRALTKFITRRDGGERSQIGICRGQSKTKKVDGNRRRASPNQSSAS